MNLNFNPLEGRPWIMNAVVRINDFLNLSVSYGDLEWYVGEHGSYEAAVQISHPDCERKWGKKYRSLVAFCEGENNVYPRCSEADLKRLIARASSLKYAGEIEVFDRAMGQTEKAWGHKFYAAHGHDLKFKLEYCKRIWGDHGYGFRLLPAK